MTNSPDPEQVLSFWFGKLNAGMSSKETAARWYKKSPAFDEEVRSRFLGLYDAIVAGDREDWLSQPRSWVAYLIVLDQFSRNMFRDAPKMYAADAQAITALTKGLEDSFDKSLPEQMRLFSYMPLMHSEQIEDQERCISLSAECASSFVGPAKEAAESVHEYAIAHHQIVAGWGRFPHRNSIVGRKSTPEELKFLETPGSSF